MDLSMVLFNFLCLAIPMVYGQARPMYVIVPAHDNNSLWEALREGANGIYTDVYFNKRGYPKSTTDTIVSKGFPFKAYSEYLGQYLRNTPEKFFIQIFNLELGDVTDNRIAKAGPNLGAMLRKNIYNSFETRFTVILMINGEPGVQFMRSWESNISSDNLGWAFKNGYSRRNYRIFHTHEKTRIWQAEITSKYNPQVPHKNIIEAMIWRGERGFKKVITGIVSLDRTLRELLAYNVDGIITTNPTGLIKIMKEEGYRDEYRLATSKDDPFKVIHVTNF